MGNENLTIEYAAEWKKILLSRIEREENVVFDFSNIVGMDLSGIQLLIAAFKEAAERKKTFHLSGRFTSEVRTFLAAGGFFSKPPKNSEDLEEDLKKRIPL